MIELKFDVAVIGAGSAGLRAFNTARKQGAKTVLIEGKKYGTTCASVGCMPSKLLIAAADAAHKARTGISFGIHADPVKVNGPEVMKRVRAERDFFTNKVTNMTLDIPETNRLMGHAAFESPKTLLIGDHTRVHVKSIVIATGSRAAVLPMFEKIGGHLVVNDDVFSWDDLPESVVVFGPGIIGLELGQALHRLGVRIRVFGINGFLGPLTDPHVKAKAEVLFGSEFPLDTNSNVKSVKVKNGKVAVSFHNDNQKPISTESPQSIHDKDFKGTQSSNKNNRSTSVHLTEEYFDYLLAATGRTPNLDTLKLGNSGLELDKHGVPKFNPLTMQCGDSNVFIAGDANADVPLLHEAADEGIIAGHNAALFPDIKHSPRHVPLNVVFTDPQIAIVGYSFSNLQESPYSSTYKVGEFDWNNDPRSRMMNTNHGLSRLYGDPNTGTLLGAEMISPRAENLAHLIAWCIEKKMTVPEILNLPFYHPVYEEGLQNALQLLNKEII